MRIKLVAVFIIFFLVNTGNVWGRVYIDIDSPSSHKFPIAVPAFKPLSLYFQKDNLSSWFADEVSRCLNVTGYFQVLDKKSFLEDQEKAGITADGIHFEDWTAVGAEYLVKGGFRADSRELSVEFRLFDVVKGELIVGKRYTGKPDDKKVMLMRFVNELLLALTGEGGNFDTRIAFVRVKGKTKDIYTINFDGSDLNRVTNYNSLTVVPRWSPDGRWMAFTSYKEGNPDLYLRDLIDGSTKKIAYHPGMNIPGSWSKDGERLLVTISREGNPDIYDMNVKSRSLQRLTKEFFIDVSPTRSPDETKIAFVSNRNGSPQIYIMDADGSNVKLLTYQGNYNTSPAWSPRGNKIAYEGSVNGRFQIFIIDINGGDPQQLTFDAYDHENPAWSPDGRYLANSVCGFGHCRIEVMNVDGSNARVLYENNEGCQGTAWSPHMK